LGPFEIRRQTVSELRRVILAMMSAEWDLALEGRSEEEVMEAARSLLQAQRARLRLGSAELREIRAELRANEEALERGRVALESALKDLHAIRTVLDAVAGFLRIIGRVVPLPA
jgi:hypothetical protein